MQRNSSRKITLLRVGGKRGMDTIRERMQRVILRSISNVFVLRNTHAVIYSKKCNVRSVCCCREGVVNIHKWKAGGEEREHTHFSLA